MQTAPQKTTAREQAAAADLRATIAPVLANGVVCAMRDQPSDPAGYMAEYLAAAGAGDAARVLDERRHAQECARLDAELIAIKEQIEQARAERARRDPNSEDAQALHHAQEAAATWHEVKRLKRITRAMKIKINEPLAPSDWPLSEGVLLVQGPRSLQSLRLCQQLASDFDVTCVDYDPHSVEPSPDPLAAVLDALRAHPESPVLLHGWMQHERAREQIELISRQVGKPTALLLIECAPHTHAQRIIDEAAEVGQSVTREAAEHSAVEWASVQLPALEAAGREVRLAVLKVGVDGDFNEQMTNLLVQACEA